MFAQLFAVMAPVIFGASIGYGWVKLGYTYQTNFVSRLTLNVGTPCLILAKLPASHVSFSTLQHIVLAMSVTMLLLGLLGYALCYWRKLDWRVFVPAMIFPNTGNMGLPISLYAFGEMGFGFAVAIMVIVSLVQFTLGSMTTSRPLHNLVRTPALYAIFISLILIKFEIAVPAWIQNSLDLISGFTIPIMLITLGVSLASIQAKNIMVGLAFGVFRTTMAIGIAIGVGYVFALGSTQTSQLMLQACMPVAVYNYLFAQRAGHSPETVASLVLCSTLLSLIYLPIILSVMFTLQHPVP